MVSVTSCGPSTPENTPPAMTQDNARGRNAALAVSAAAKRNDCTTEAYSPASSVAKQYSAKDCSSSAPAATTPASAPQPLPIVETIPAARVQEVIEGAGESLVSHVRLLEDYRDAKLGAGMKSMLWSIAYRAPDRTLTDVEVDKAHEAIVGRLVENLPAQRR